MEHFPLPRTLLCISLSSVIDDRDVVERLLGEYPSDASACMETALRSLLETSELPPMQHLSSKQLYDYLATLWYRHPRAYSTVHRYVSYKLHKAAELGLLYLIPYLKRIDPVVYLEEASTMLLVASTQGIVPVVKYILDHISGHVIPKGRLSLSSAAQIGNLEIVKLLIEKGVDVDAKVPESGTEGGNPLIFAATYGHCNVVKYLLDNKANASAQDDAALTVAATYDSAEIVKLLLDAGAGKIQGDIALDNAARDGHLKTVKTLIDAGIWSDAVMHNAAIHGHGDIVQYLLTLPQARELSCKTLEWNYDGNDNMSTYNFLISNGVDPSLHRPGTFNYDPSDYNARNWRDDRDWQDEFRRP